MQRLSGSRDSEPEEIEDQSLHGRDIVCVGFADWGTDLWTNQHHLMHRLAARNRVLFVESLGLRRPQLAGRDISRIVRRLRSGLRPPREVDGLHVLSPLVIPMHGNAALRAINAKLLRALVRRATRRLGMSKPILWAYVPQAETLVQTLEPSLVVYHCVDDIAAQERIDEASFKSAEKRFAGDADIVLASAQPLVERMKRLSGNVIYAPNVADVGMFAKALDPGPTDAALQALPSPRIVFTGAVVSIKLDFDLIVSLARLRRDWSIALVGPIGPGDPTTDVSALAAEPNIHLLGHRPHDRLPEVLRGADVGLIPYAINRLTSSIFPMKVYEYLAAGLPVVSTALPSLSGVSGISTGADAAQVATAIEQELAFDDDKRREERSEMASTHSWDARLREIAAAVLAVEREHSAGR